MKKSVLAILLFSTIGFAQSIQAKIIFSCKTNNNKYIEVNQVGGQIYEYKFGSASQNELTIRNTKAELLKRSDKWQGAGRGRWSNISFKNGEYLYNVFVNFDSIDHSIDSGVNIERKGKTIANVLCTPQTAQANFDDDHFAW